MRKHCEVCKNMRPGAAHDGRAMVEMKFDGRTVVLCSGHARIAENSGVRSFEALRELYGSGRRSHVPRRSPASKLRGSYERHGLGRRATDAP